MSAHDEHGDWESRYAAVDRLWSGSPNAVLARLAGAWSPGSSLDLGCGEGADVVWLARHGWRATGVDVSATAVSRMKATATAQGVGGLVTGAVLNITVDPLPDGPFDLVTSFYLHGPDEPGSPWLARILAEAARRVAPGGRLLAVTHCVNPPWLNGHHARTYTPSELRGQMGSAVSGWRTEMSRENWRDVVGPDGEAGRRSDAVVCLRRPPDGEAATRVL